MKLTGFAFGIRTVKSFAVEDKLGAIADEILFSEKSDFNYIMFPEVRENYNTKILIDPSTNNKLSITPRDFIFDYNIKKDFIDEFEKYLKCYVSVLTKDVFTKFNIKNVSRFGFVVKAELDGKDQLLTDVSSVITKRKGIDDSLSLRFNVITKKPLKLPSDFVTEDYDNEIVTYDKVDTDSLVHFSVDYQKYFKPELNIIEDAPQDFGAFCNHAFKAFQKNYLS